MLIVEHNKTKSVGKAKITLTSPKDMFERITQESNDPKKKRVWSRDTFRLNGQKDTVTFTTRNIISLSFFYRKMAGTCYSFKEASQ